jgi:hypothetical protein
MPLSWDFSAQRFASFVGRLSVSAEQGRNKGHGFWLCDRATSGAVPFIPAPLTRERCSAVHRFREEEAAATGRAMAARGMAAEPESGKGDMPAASKAAVGKGQPGVVRVPRSYG